MRRIAVSLLMLLLCVFCLHHATAADVPARAGAHPGEVPFLPSEHPDSSWVGHESSVLSLRYLDIDESGQCELRLGGYNLGMTVKESNAYTLFATLSENQYTAPAYTLPLAEARFWTDGASVRVEITDDFYGIFTDCSAEECVLPYQAPHHEWRPYAQHIIFPSELPGEQPNTYWGLAVRIDDQLDVLKLDSSQDGLVRGTWEHGRDTSTGGPFESTIPCALLTNYCMAAVVAVEEGGYGEMLLFGRIPDIDDCNERPYVYTSLKIVPDYCRFGTPIPFNIYSGSRTAGYLKLVKESTEGAEIYGALFDGDYAPVMGVDRILVDHLLGCGGWKRMDPSKNSDTFWKYQKDGDTLAVVFDECDTDFGFSTCAVERPP